jgi:soluble epoxide hydrolase/lipid-phosphate phosphatase
MGASRAWLNANIITSLPSWLSPGYKLDWLRIYSQPDIIVSSLNYYKALMRGVQAADETGLTDEDRALRVPVLAVGSVRDCLP